MGNHKSSPILSISIEEKTNKNISLMSNTSGIQDTTKYLTIKSLSKIIKSKEKKSKIISKASPQSVTQIYFNTEIKNVNKNTSKRNSMIKSDKPFVLHLVETRDNFKQKSNEIISQIKHSSIRRKYLKKQSNTRTNKRVSSNIDAIDDTKVEEPTNNQNESEYTNINEINKDHKKAKKKKISKQKISNLEIYDDYGFYEPNTIQVQDKVKNKQIKQQHSSKAMINDKYIQSNLYSKVKRNFFSSTLGLFINQQQNERKSKGSILQIFKVFTKNQTTQKRQSTYNQYHLNTNDNCIYLNRKEHDHSIVLELPVKRFDPIEEFFNNNIYSTIKESNYESLTKYMSKKTIINSKLDRDSSSTLALSSCSKSDFYESLVTQYTNSQKHNDQKLIRHYSSDETDYIQLIQKKKAYQFNSYKSDNIYSGDYQSLREYEPVTNYNSNADKTSIKNNHVLSINTEPPPIPSSSLPSKHKLSEQLSYSLF